MEQSSFLNLVQNTIKKLIPLILSRFPELHCEGYHPQENDHTDSVFATEKHNNKNVDKYRRLHWFIQTCCFWPK